MMRAIAPALALASLLVSMNASAVPLTFSFQTAIDATGFGGGSADTLLMEMVVDSEAPNIAFSSEGRYLGTMSVSIGNQSASGLAQVIIENDRTDIGYDRIGFFANSFTGFFGTMFGRSATLASFNFYDSSMSALPDISLPTSINLSAFNSVDGGVNLGGVANFPVAHRTPIEQASFVFSGPEPVSVPEPATLSLMLLGFLTVASMRRRIKA